MKLIKKTSGITIWELALFTVFLAIAGGASVFFFFLNSKDVQTAQKKYDWIREVNETLDDVCLEISNSIMVEHPFDRESRECVFKSAATSGDLSPSIKAEGFSFTESGLNYISKSGSGSDTAKRFEGRKNPLIKGCKNGKFVRPKSDCMKISFSLSSPTNKDEVRKFSRTIYLRNR
jgi:hypothetical protein